jgi:uncharacterized DUF497 family protein
MVDFDPAEEAINLSKHGVSLARWVDLDIAVALVDDRYDYGEVRYRAYGYIDGVAYCFGLHQSRWKGASDQPSTRAYKGDEALCLVN